MNNKIQGKTFKLAEETQMQTTSPRNEKDNWQKLSKSTQEINKRLSTI